MRFPRTPRRERASLCERRKCTNFINTPTRNSRGFTIKRQPTPDCSVYDTRSQVTREQRFWLAMHNWNGWSVCTWFRSLNPIDRHEKQDQTSTHRCKLFKHRDYTQFKVERISNPTLQLMSRKEPRSPIEATVINTADVVTSFFELSYRSCSHG